MTHMERALHLAKKAKRSVSPNPAVGAVIVKNGIIVGEGFTHPPGKEHAEIIALRQAGPDCREATLYTTLEPCSHEGRTQACTTAIIKAGITEVRFAMIDPNPLVNGTGVACLNKAGIETSFGENAEEARDLMEAYLKFITTRTPFVTAKFAMSLDGKIATTSGESKWITGNKARAYSHTIRAESDAIMVGINTILTDNPKLTARDEHGVCYERQPLRIVADSHGRTPIHAKVFSEPGETLVVSNRIDEAQRKNLTKAGAQVEIMPRGNTLINIPALLKSLALRNKTTVLVEGGSTLLGTMFDERLIDKVIAFIAPIIIGGIGAPSSVKGRGVTRISEALRLHRVKVCEIGGDVVVVGYTSEENDVHRDS